MIKIQEHLKAFFIALLSCYLFMIFYTQYLQYGAYEDVAVYLFQIFIILVTSVKRELVKEKHSLVNDLIYSAEVAILLGVFARSVILATMTLVTVFFMSQLLSRLERLKGVRKKRLTGDAFGIAVIILWFSIANALAYFAIFDISIVTLVMSDTILIYGMVCLYHYGKQLKANENP